MKSQVRNGGRGRARTVREFFEHWDVYGCIIENNYMFHREIYAAVHRQLKIHFPTTATAYKMLELGCGDASCTAKAVQDTPIAFYSGCDLSSAALQKARRNMAEVPCRQEFTRGDFFEIIKTEQRRWDVVLAGFSIHHLTNEGKGELLGRCRALLNKGGILLILDPYRREDETRKAFLQRWGENCEAGWTEVPPANRALFRQHIFAHDYPETLQSMEQLARRNGFTRTKLLYLDPPQLHGLLLVES